MKATKHMLWETIPGTTHTIPYVMHYAPEEKRTNGALVVFPGSGYAVSPSVPRQEGERIAEFFCAKGISVFVVEYRVAPDFYPLPILDGRRAVRYIRYHSKEFGISEHKIAVMGFSAGGHLTASLSAHFDRLEGEGLDAIDKESYFPDLQLLCYPVISLDDGNDYSHVSSGTYLLGEQYEKRKKDLSFENSSTSKVPPTFLWHNFDDKCVSVIHSLKYAENLKKRGIPAEIHIFPDGDHGMGFPIEDRRDYNHARKWITLALDWLIYHHFFE